MIHHMRQEREQLLGKPPVCPVSAPDSAPSLPAKRSSGEPDAEVRRRTPLLHSGYTNGLEIVYNFGVSFQELVADVNTIGRPLADVGASCSTLSFELALRGAKCFSFDPNYKLNNPIFQRVFTDTCAKLAPVYTQRGQLPSGNEVTAIRPECWPSYVDVVVKELFKDMSRCFGSELAFQDGVAIPNRFFSTVMSHQSLPKYLSTDAFLEKVLPELLRVADKRVILFPLVTAGPGNELVYLPGTPERARLDQVLQREGFSLQLTQSPLYADKVASGEFPPGYDIAGHFVRNRG